ncbi:hypothetical protein GJAV_G00040810 [Gymnothorax javanicus]|nr:hypothetical protein GJAV_G00040810 [Gymnothorax javanicus]
MPTLTLLHKSRGAEQSDTAMALTQLGLLRPLLRQSSARLAVVAVLAPGLQNPPRHRVIHPPPLARLYATKKKAKSKGQPAKVNINPGLVEDIINLEGVKADMTAVLNALKEDLSRNLSIRTSPGALDHITLPGGHGGGCPGPQRQQHEVNPEVEGAIIRVPIPKVTREHRENLAKLAKQFCNKAKESLRRVRSGAITQLKREKDRVSEDTIRLIEKQVQQMTESFTADIEKQLATKTKELLG